MMMETTIFVENAISEMRRGVIILAVLSQLEEEQYGYSLVKSLADQGMMIDQGTLYPLLRRLETQGLLQSQWRIEDGRPRRYYRSSPDGKAVVPKLMAEWNSLGTVLAKVLESKGGVK
jgi:PadR family transcriptional regulator PadR